jgi:hypothetical protein
VARSRLPSVIRLPFGFVIQVKQTSRRRMARIVEAKLNEEPPVACWLHDGRDDAGGTIWLLRTREQKISDIIHELHHGLVDWGSWVQAKERGDYDNDAC